tara:strand:- start:759 stop:887 length:129 start_codon:yes stop_codon:yes gene_type:complete
MKEFVISVGDIRLTFTFNGTVTLTVPVDGTSLGEIVDKIVVE